MQNSMYHKNFSYILSGLVFALATLSPGISDATTYYVAKTGNDSNPGTEFSPFRNIKHGVSSLSAGDTLYVKAGTYYESILSWKTTIPNGTSWSNPVTVAANPGDTVTIHPSSGSGFFWVIDGMAKYLIIDGFIVDGGFNGFKFSNNSRFIRVQNSEIKNTSQNCIMVSVCMGCSNAGEVPNKTYHEFINLKVHDSGSPEVPKHAIYISTGHNLLESSEIYNASGYGAHFYKNTFNNVNYNIIRNNTFHDNNTAGVSGCGLILSSGKGNVAYNNVFYGNIRGLCTAYRTTDAMLYNNIAYQNDKFGLYIGAGSDHTQAFNNTVYHNGIYGIFVGDGSRDAVIRNNIAYKNKTADIYQEPNDQTGTAASHNFTEDPSFLDPGTKSFSLRPNSPAINAGTSISLVPDDFQGTKRPQGSSHDIGAYEFLSGGDTTAPISPKKIKIF